MNQTKWEKTDNIGPQNLLVPVLNALKLTLEHEKNELQEKLNSLRRLGVIQIDKQELDKKLQEMKFSK
jgi:hypothetical protein